MLRLILSLAQVILDVIIYQACFSIAPVTLAFESRAFLIGTMLAFFTFDSLYGFRNWTFWEETKSVLRSGIMILLVSALFIYASKTKFPFVFMLVVLSAYLAVDLTVRYFFRRVLFTSGLLHKSVIILGAGSAGELFAQSITSSTFVARNVVGFLDDDDDKQGTLIAGVPVLGKLGDFERVQSELHADEAVIAIPTASRKTLAGILNVIDDFVDHVLYIPDMYMLTTMSATVSNIDGMPIISASQGLLSPMNRCIKSVVDYVGGIVALVLASPLMLYTAWKIKREDGGRVLFKHKRIGRELKPFGLYKFRTMVPNAEDMLQEMMKDEKLRAEFEEAFKFKNDPRITKIGKFLRRTSLDELPQIFNVLKGEMSLVGPRPIVQREVELYYGERTARQIFHVKPGMTGFWQVSGRNDVDNYDKRIAYDLYYIHNWSVWLDIMIMLRTVREVFKGTGAY